MWKCLFNSLINDRPTKMLTPDQIRFRLRDLRSLLDKSILHYCGQDSLASLQTGSIGMTQFSPNLLIPLQSCRLVQSKTIRSDTVRSDTWLGWGTIPQHFIGGERIVFFAHFQIFGNFPPIAVLQCMSVCAHGALEFSSNFVVQARMGRNLPLNPWLYLNSAPCGSAPTCLSWTELKSLLPIFETCIKLRAHYMLVFMVRDKIDF